MRRVRNSILAGLAICTVAGEAAAGLLNPVEHNRLAGMAQQRPMVFFVAKGPADSCGKGCSEWIAAVGVFDSQAKQRFEELLAKLNGRNLPVFFDSPGGLVNAGFLVGAALRERRMTTAVGRTEAKCRVFDKKDADCQRRIKAGEAVSARLVTKDAQCGSACVHAFAGGASRHVAPMPSSRCIRPA